MHTLMDTFASNTTNMRMNEHWTADTSRKNHPYRVETIKDRIARARNDAGLGTRRVLLGQRTLHRVRLARAGLCNRQTQR